MKEKALNYHKNPRPGKIGIKIKKPMQTLDDLGLAYTPGVAVPCQEIKKDIKNAYKYTSKGNTVAVISNGSAVLGLGNIGALAGKPVMEGKAALFKLFAGIDACDIEIDSQDAFEIINIIKAISPTFGGINLEDIKAPECFEIEEKLIELLDIPVFHDDQHGTAIIVCAAILNACQIQNKKLGEIKIVVSGAGSGAIASLHLLINLGAKLENIYTFDSKGLINKKRSDLNKYKKYFIQNIDDLSFSECMEDADLFLGLSKANIVSKEMIKKMSKNPIILALANPIPEILPDEVKKARDDAVIATGRSDFPNQVNNVLCFPHLFRGALDCHAKKINNEMKIAAVKAIANIAHETVPNEILNIYKKNKLSFGKEYIIPTPFDKRLYFNVSKAVIKAAIETNVAQNPIKDFDEYENYLKQLIF